jgi:hypothetical protein
LLNYYTGETYNRTTDERKEYTWGGSTESVGSGRQPRSGDFRWIVAYKVVKEKGSIERGGACFEG